MKKGLVMMSIASLGLLVACGPSDDKQTDESTTVSTSTQSSVKEKVAETESTKEEEHTINMAINDIMAYDYASIAGEWHDVATSVNRQNGKGFGWEGPLGDTLRVTKDELIFPHELVLKGETLAVKGDTIQLAYTKSHNDRVLIAGSYDQAVSYHIFFYPKGVDMTDFGEDLPDTVNTDKDKIIFRTNGFVQVYEPTTGAETTRTESQQEFDVSAIEQLDYSSANGTWKNAKGFTLTVKDNQLDIEDVKSASADGLPATVNQLVIDIPSENDGAGQPNVTKLGTSDVPSYAKELQVTMEDGAVFLKGTAFRAMLYVGFIPKGETGGIGISDSEKDRIVTGITQESLDERDPAYVYYKISDN